ncbi:hypothetical protein N7522_003649 [Penicillium canescens]|nr:hypothetical protein N7522_003649 [Penicillium canescens]
MAYAKSRSPTASRAYGPGFAETKALTTLKSKMIPALPQPKIHVGIISTFFLHLPDQFWL